MKDLYFAACTGDGGIYHYKKDGEKISFVKKYDLDRPMYLAIEGDKMYVIIRELSDGYSAVASYNINKDGSLSDLSKPVSVKGVCACHLCVENGRVYTANYLSGNLSIAGEKTVAHSGIGPNRPRQDVPHCHYINFTSDKKYLLACDLGNDTIYTYDKNLLEVSRARVPMGHGCRHLVMSKKHETVYCINELLSTVTVFEIKDGVLTPLETVSALRDNFKGVSTAAAIRLSEDERYLYTSNRGEDSVCVFEISDDGRSIERKATIDICGGSPRDFDIIDGYMFVTNETSNNVTVFKTEGESAEKLSTELSMPNPLCVVYR